MADAHTRAAQAREATVSTAALVARGKAEFKAARAQLLSLEAATRSHAAKLEQAIRAADPAPTLEPAPDRAAIVTRLATAEAVYKKLEGEHQQAEARLATALGGVNQAATGVVAALFEIEVQRLAALELSIMEYRASLRRVSQWWPNNKMLPLSEFASSTLVNNFAFDKLRFMGNPAASEPWQRLLVQLQLDPNAQFGDIEDTEAEAA